MKRFPVIGTLLPIPAIAMFFVTIGCQNDVEMPADAGPKIRLPIVAKKTKITGETVGTLTGVVKFDGDVPAGKPNAGIVGHKDFARCEATKNKNDLLDQTWLVDKDGGVANVAISLVPAADREYAGGIERKEQVVLDAPFCAYVPHVVALQADVQELTVRNSGTLNHHTKITSNPKFAAPGNAPVGVANVPKPQKFKFELTPINIACSMHSFMSAKLLTFKHPYFAVTDSKGTFSIANIPVGEELTVHVWHESMGDKGQNRQKISLQKGKAKSIELKIK